MGLILKSLKVIGDKGGKQTKVLFDSGAALSFVRKDTAEELSTIIKMPVPRRFRLGDGETQISTHWAAYVSVTINGRNIDDLFYVLEKLGEEIILGANTMQKWEITIEPKTEKVSVGRDPDAIEFF